MGHDRKRKFMGKIGNFIKCGIYHKKIKFPSLKKENEIYVVMLK